VTITQLLDKARLEHRAEDLDKELLVLWPSKQQLTVYRGGKLRIQIQTCTVTAFQAWTKADVYLINAVLMHVDLHTDYGCIYGKDCMLIKREPLTIDTAATLLKRQAGLLPPEGVL
jgi:hypothetical protein